MCQSKGLSVFSFFPNKKKEPKRLTSTPLYGTKQGMILLDEPIDSSNLLLINGSVKPSFLSSS